MSIVDAAEALEQLQHQLEEMTQQREAQTKQQEFTDQELATLEARVHELTEERNRKTEEAAGKCIVNFGVLRKICIGSHLPVTYQNSIGRSWI